MNCTEIGKHSSSIKHTRVSQSSAKSRLKEPISGTNATDNIVRTSVVPDPGNGVTHSDCSRKVGGGDIETPVNDGSTRIKDSGSSSGGSSGGLC